MSIWRAYEIFLAWQIQAKVNLNSKQSCSQPPHCDDHQANKKSDQQWPTNCEGYPMNHCNLLQPKTKDQSSIATANDQHSTLANSQMLHIEQ
jgi:hypothetical protein